MSKLTNKVAKSRAKREAVVAARKAKVVAVDQLGEALKAAKPARVRKPKAKAVETPAAQDAPAVKPEEVGPAESLGEIVHALHTGELDAAAERRAQDEAAAAEWKAKEREGAIEAAREKLGHKDTRAAAINKLVKLKVSDEQITEWDNAAKQQKEDDMKNGKSTRGGARKRKDGGTSGAAKRRKDAGVTQKDGKTMSDEIVRLASRKNGVTPAQLNEATGWKGAPWRWLFTNPKGTGLCDKRKLKFKAEKGEGRAVTYFIL